MPGMGGEQEGGEQIRLRAGGRMNAAAESLPEREDLCVHV